MRKPSEETIRNSQIGFMWLYLSDTFMCDYDNCNNYKDKNYIFWRLRVKQENQDIFIVIQTSQHYYNVSHYRILDGFNELKRFSTLYSVAQYLKKSASEYDKVYAEYVAEEAQRKEERLKEREAKKAKKANSSRKSE